MILERSRRHRSLLAIAGVNVEYAYGSAVADHAMASIVAGVEDPQRAATAAGV